MQLSIFLLGVLHTVTADRFWRSPFYRSFEESLSECADYFNLSSLTVDRYMRDGFPNEPSVKKVIHCTLIDLQAWDSQLGVIGRQLIGSLSGGQFNEQNEERIQCCLRNSQVDDLKNHVLERAYHSFLCYFNVYEFSGSSSQQYLRYTDDIQKRFMREAILIQNVQVPSLLEYCKENPVSPPEWSNVAFTFFIRTGFYSQEKGFNFEHLYAQFGALELLGEEIKTCQHRAVSQFCVEPQRAFQIFEQCLIPYVTTYEILHAAANELVTEAGLVCPNDSNPSASVPCYNGYKPKIDFLIADTTQGTTRITRPTTRTTNRSTTRRRVTVDPEKLT
ncbi:uncharacterized protein LOC129741490 [Uranotaenia lowii]|uniref:uncharacterized protein LOC129741490 n=1 Tax=Uranotaenia lowii TaxID=190385 RepID=UPI00247AD414|nr:uncharacterized protein LOC129741490 [Uranotaenia lowii]